jgi:hypothetical protein
MCFWNPGNFRTNDDVINQNIWTESPMRQQQIRQQEQAAAANGQPGGQAAMVVGAQQAMPKPEHAGDGPNQFSENNPLPWVPDIVGREFGRQTGKSLLIVGSAYAGIITDYSHRHGICPQDYCAARQGGNMALFLAEFIHHVILDCPHDHELQEQCFDRNGNYYGPIRELLENVVDGKHVALTDLCKASFIRRGNGGDGNRQDDSNQKVAQIFSDIYYRYVKAGENWTWSRLGSCKNIVALGDLTLRGLLSLFLRRTAAVAQVQNGNVQLNWEIAHTEGLTQPNTAWINMDLEYRAAPVLRFQITLNGRIWQLLRVRHPSRRTDDPQYQLGQDALRNMLNG